MSIASMVFECIPRKIGGTVHNASREQTLSLYVVLDDYLPKERKKRKSKTNKRIERRISRPDHQQDLRDDVGNSCVKFFSLSDRFRMMHEHSFFLVHRPATHPTTQYTWRQIEDTTRLVLKSIWQRNYIKSTSRRLCCLWLLYSCCWLPP